MAAQRPYARLLGTLISLSVLCGGCDIGNSRKTTPTITWASPSAITYGTALSATQLNATASVAGSFAYNPPASTVSNAGAETLSVTFMPTDSAKYNSASATVSLTVNKATPTITWPEPGAITSGTALSATQLDATASVPGSFVYIPPATTVLSAGTQSLSVTFTPTDSTNYSSASKSVSLTVNATSGIGPSGGTVTGFYGARVTVPAGALSTNVDIAIPRDSSNAPALPASGVDTAGATYALTPHGTAFSQPATVQIPFDSARIPADAAPVLYKAEPGGAFAAIPTTVNGNMLSANVSDFSWVIPGFASTLPRMVYALTNANVNGTNTISVSSFKITKGSGTLSAATSTAQVGSGAISVTVHPSRRFAYVTNGSGSAHGVATNVFPNSISVYQLDAVTGAISGPTDTKPVNGNPVSVVVHPTGKFIYVVNEVRFGGTIGNVSVFSIDSATGTLTSQGTAADLGGVPVTALAFPPSGEFAYVTYLPPDPQNNNNFDTVKTYGVSTTSGLFSSSPLGSASTGNNPWAIAVTPGGRFAYVASLGTQGNVNELSIYSINQQTGVLTLQNSLSLQGAQPASLAMDSEARFLYVGRQQSTFNRNLEVYSINPSNGGLSLVAGVLLSDIHGGSQGPIAVTAEPQGQFIYAIANNELVAFAVNATTGALTPAGTPVGGVFEGGANGGVGDPFFFAASGTSPVWQDNCTIEVDSAFPFDGCPVPFLSSGPGSGGGGGNPLPAATFVLTVSLDPAWGGNIVSSPAGIDYSSEVLSRNTFQHAFPNGSTVSLRETPASAPVQAYDVRWTGSCSGTGNGTSVVMSQDQHCYLSLTPVSTR